MKSTLSAIVAVLFSAIVSTSAVLAQSTTTISTRQSLSANEPVAVNDKTIGANVLSGNPRSNGILGASDAKSETRQTAYAVARREALERANRSGQSYSYVSLQEARAEIERPQPTAIPSNDDVFLRRLAMVKVGAYAPNDDAFSELRANYKRYLNTLVGASPFQESISTGIFADAATVGVESSLDDERYKSFAWRIEVPTSSEVGDPIPIKVELVNTSSASVRVSCPWERLSFFYLNSILICRVDNHEIVSLTAKGAHDYYGDGRSKSRNEAEQVELEAGKTFELLDRTFDLAENYDLSKPGEYELIFYTRQYCDEFHLPLENQMREYPRNATVRFTVTAKSGSLKPQNE